MKYKVCIHSITYNQEEYIEDALKGIISQVTDFPFVAVVIDDHSTDGTADIVRRYERDFPDIIKGIYLQENYQSQRKSKIPLFSEYNLKSEYFAFCEGDDYWIDTGKLQKQADYLDSHPECILCCSAALWEVDGKIVRNDAHHTEDCDLTTDEVIRNGGLYLPSASLMFRPSLKQDIPAWWMMADVTDYPLQIAATLKGQCHYFVTPSCVYRYCHNNSWTSEMSKRSNLPYRISHSRTEIAWMKELDKETGFRYTGAIHCYLRKVHSFLFTRSAIGLKDYLAAVRLSDESFLLKSCTIVRDVIKRFLIRTHAYPLFQKACKLFAGAVRG